MSLGPFCLTVDFLVVIGNIIYVQEQNATDGRWVEGHVHFVRSAAKVDLQFYGSFIRYAEGRRLCMRFRLNGIYIRRQYQAVDIVFSNDGPVLFPVARDSHTDQYHCSEICSLLCTTR